MAASIYLALHYVIPASKFTLIGWRWMFWIGAVTALIGLVVRIAVPESVLWEEVSRRGVNKAPLTTILRTREYALGALTGVLAMTGIAWIYGLTLGFYPTVLSYHNFMKFPYFLYVVIIAILISMIGYILSGTISDYIGRRTTMIIYSTLAIITAVPLTYLIMNHAYGFYGILGAASLLAFLTREIHDKR